MVLDEIHGNALDEIQPLRLLAEYLQSKQKRDAVLSQLEQRLSSNVNNETLILVAATIYINENNLEAAYKVLHASDSLEAMAFIIDILLMLDRADLAKKV